MLGPQRLQPRQARAAVHHVVLGMNLEPQAGQTGSQCRLKMLRLQAQTSAQMRLPHSVLRVAGHQLFIGISEPMPLGVFMLAQVPAGT